MTNKKAHMLAGGGGTETISAINRLVELMSQADLNLLSLDNRIKGLNKYEQTLPADQLQEVRDTSVRIEPLRIDSSKCYRRLRTHVRSAPCCSDERIVYDSFMGFRIPPLTNDFLRGDLEKHFKKLDPIFQNAEFVAVEIHHKTQGLTKSRFTEYAMSNESSFLASENCDGYLTSMQTLGNSEDEKPISDFLQKLVIDSGGDANKLRQLRRDLEAEKQQLVDWMAQCESEAKIFPRELSPTDSVSNDESNKG